MAGRPASSLRLVECLLESLYSEKPWARFLEELRDQLGADVATLILTPPSAAAPAFMLAPGGDPQVARDYLASYFRHDMFTGLPEGRVIRFNEFIGAPGRRRGEPFARMMEIAGSDCILGLDLRAGSGCEARFRVNRETGGRDFDATDCALLTSLVPHLRHGISLFERLAATGAECSLYSGAIERMLVGTIILDADHRILSCNAVGEHLLRRKDGLVPVAGRLRIGTAQQDERIRAWSARLRGSEGNDMPLAQVEHITRTSACDLVVTLRWLPKPLFMRSGAVPALAVFINDPERAAEISAEVVRSRFALTVAEARVAAALSNGLSLVEAASAAGIAHNTARAQLQSIFRKLDVKRQSQLVQLIHKNYTMSPSSLG